MSKVKNAQLDLGMAILRKGLEKIKDSKYDYPKIFDQVCKRISEESYWNAISETQEAMGFK